MVIMSKLIPLTNTIIQPNDQIIVLVEDDSTIKLTEPSDVLVQSDLIEVSRQTKSNAEKILILGWNWRGAEIINQLDCYVSPGSNVAIAACRNFPEIINNKCSGLKNLTPTFIFGDTTDRRTLDNLKIETYDHVILLCYSDLFDNQQADAKTLITLYIYGISGRRRGSTFQSSQRCWIFAIVIWLKLPKRMILLLVIRLYPCYSPRYARIKIWAAYFMNYLAPGSEVYLKPAQNYVKLNVPVNFYTVIESAIQKGESVLGYQRGADINDASQHYMTVINPGKSAPVTFTENDRMIVLSETGL